MRADGYRWWIERFRRTFELVDLTRIDHFRGFVSYWAVPAAHTTARARPLAARARRSALPRARGGARRAAGRRRGSRRDHRAGRRGCGASSGCPGWSCSSSRSASDPTNPHLPQNHEEQSVVYTGTHDNDTTRGWWESADCRAARVVGARPRRPGMVADRGGVGLARGTRDRAAAGRARARQRGADEPARHRGGQLAVALRRRRPDRRARRPAARADGAQRTTVSGWKSGRRLSSSRSVRRASSPGLPSRPRRRSRAPRWDRPTTSLRGRLQAARRAARSKGRRRSCSGSPR